MSDIEVEGKLKVSTAELSLKAAVYAVVDAASGTTGRYIKLQTPPDKEDDSFYIAILRPAEMELVLESREKEEEG